MTAFPRSQIDEVQHKMAPSDKNNDCSDSISDTMQIPHYTVSTTNSETSLDNETRAELVRGQVGEHDVLLGRSKVAHSHPGNKQFRSLIRQNREEYQQAQFRKVKNKVVRRIIDTIVQRGGRFLKFSQAGEAFTPISQDDCYEKVSHALRSARSKKGAMATSHSAPTLHEAFQADGGPTRRSSRNLSYKHLLSEQKRHFQMLCSASQTPVPDLPQSQREATATSTEVEEDNAEMMMGEHIVPLRLSCKVSMDPNEVSQFLGPLLEDDPDGE